MPAHLLPEGVDLEAELGAHLDLRAERSRAVSWTFYDTFDGRLRAAGLALRHGDGRLALLDRESGAERAAIPWARAPRRLLAADLGTLRGPLEPVIDVRALLPIAAVRGRRQRLAVLNDDEKIVVRLVADAPVVRGAALPPRLHAGAVRGYDADLARVQSVLEGPLGLPERAPPLPDEAVAAAGGDPGGTSSKLGVALARTERADAAAGALAARLLAILEANLPGTLAGVDTEFLHDLRVAVRRTRSLQRQLRDVFPPEPLARFREEAARSATTARLRPCTTCARWARSCATCSSCSPASTARGSCGRWSGR